MTSSNSFGTCWSCTNIEKNRQFKDDFKNMKLKLNKKFTGWKVRILSLVGTVVLKTNLTGIT